MQATRFLMFSGRPGKLASIHSHCTPIFVFLEIELPYPKPEQHQEDPQRVDLPVRLRPVGAFEPKAHHSGEHDKDADNLFYLHAPTIAQISASDLRLKDVIAELCLKRRHARACPGHPRLTLNAAKTWMAGTQASGSDAVLRTAVPAMTMNWLFEI
jgi:hypothetical protein